MLTTQTRTERTIQVTLLRPHAKQLEFIDSKSKRKIVRAGRRSGKTTGISIYHVERFLSGRRQLYTAPTDDQVSRFWTETCRALAGPIAAGVFTKNEQRRVIELPGTEQRIRAKTAWNADTLRGDYADDLTFDEWQLTNEEAWEYVGQPMLMDNDGDAVFIYTPPSLHSRSTTKARDPRHAAKMYAAALTDPAWEAFHFTSHDNPHLSRTGLESAEAGMTALAYRQEILAEDVNEAPGALWTRAELDAHRVSVVPENLIRVGVGIDPSGGATECGIVVAGIAPCSCKGFEETHGFLLNDATPDGSVSPDVWSGTAIDVYTEWDADRIFAEANFGGDMVEHTIRTADKSVRIEMVHASRGKAVRAEPVAALAEQGKIHHVGKFDELEDELCGWIPGVSPRSPNRLDAMVWALTRLMVRRGRKVEWA